MLSCNERRTGSSSTTIKNLELDRFKQRVISAFTLLGEKAEI
ncbi:protein of unknown function [Vibrio tapetis subsp. tapetis]|uniref:Uncharacterized protein n=1 Tax=Vibrio tapetis subsp. tapetis TaxID=1671868 RepID=A0A2N8ZHG4_9VIBR|nr:protein of unknown function [Vibrio tapetis subsp. tapetis]